MKLILIILLFSHSSFAFDFSCSHEDNFGQSYIVESVNGAFCLRKVLDDGTELKFDLFPIPEPVESRGNYIYSNLDRNFNLSIVIPNGSGQSSGVVTHLDESGDELVNVKTTCYLQ